MTTGRSLAKLHGRGLFQSGTRSLGRVVGVNAGDGKLLVGLMPSAWAGTPSLRGAGCNPIYARPTTNSTSFDVILAAIATCTDLVDSAQARPIHMGADPATRGESSMWFNNPNPRFRPRCRRS